MKKLFYVIIFSFLLTSANAVFASKMNFQFQISDYHTQRQAGQTLDVYVRYAIKNEADASTYPDYRELREVVIGYLEPTANLPVNVFWEIIAAQLAEDLMSRYSFSGISVQLLVHPNEKGVIFEPGFHGPIYTVGDVIPLSQVVIPAAH